MRRYEKTCEPMNVSYFVYFILCLHVSARHSLPKQSFVRRPETDNLSCHVGFELLGFASAQDMIT